MSERRWWHGYFGETDKVTFTVVTEPQTVPPWEAARSETVGDVECVYRMSWDHEPTEAEKDTIRESAKGAA